MANETEILDKVKKFIKTDKLVYGSERAYKEIFRKNASDVVLSSNVPKEVEEDLTRYAEISQTQLVKVNMPNDALGTFCKKPFPVSVLTILK